MDSSQLDEWRKNRVDTPAWHRDEYDENDDICSIPGCGKTHWDDGQPLSYFRIVVRPGEEGYAEVAQALCDAHSQRMAFDLIDLGFGSHNHHGTNTLDAEDICGGYGKCPYPAEYGPELVHPDRSTRKKLYL